MALNDAGRVVSEMWSNLPGRYPGVALDEFVVMPDHFHGIVVIDSVGAIHESPDNNADKSGAIRELPLRCVQRRKMLLSKIIGFFKMNSAKQINLMRDNPGCPVWQRNYYERVIRDERELDAARKYILENPIKWDLDKEKPGERATSNEQRIVGAGSPRPGFERIWFRRGAACRAPVWI